MAEKLPGIGQWKILYEAMRRLKGIAPWEYLEEDDLFAVQDPETNEIGFVSIMGAIGEHYAISVYLGEKGLYGFWDLHRSTPDELSYQRFFEIPQLQASFEDRDILHPKDRTIMKKLGLSFRGKHSWPMFRSFRPGCFPWYLNGKEARFLHYVLEQTIDVTQRLKKDGSLVETGCENTYLLRKGIRKKDTIIWQDSTLKMIPQVPHQKFTVNMSAIANLKNKAPGQATVEIDLVMSTEPVQEKKDRPYYPYILLMVDTGSGAIVGFQLLKPLPTFDAMWGTVSSEVVDLLAKTQVLPEKILVSSEILHHLVSCICENLCISLELKEELPNVAQARAMLLDFFG